MRNLFILAAVAIGLAAGVGIFTFGYAGGASYMHDDPRVCANCHVMNEQYAGWTHGSHRAVATCNDCHTPPGLVPKYMTKAINGYNHSFAFTTGRFHEPIQIGPRNRAITERACRKCHDRVVDAIDSSAAHTDKTLSCIRCHDSVGHLTR
jgi:cytochrome c nitrite reductase small subunit